MATRPYFFAFGSGNPATNTGLAPTFISFVNSSGATQTPPSISEKYVGTGLYECDYMPTQTIAFVLDGATAGLATSDRYITGVFDPNDLFGVTLIAVGNTTQAFGNTSIALGMTGVALSTNLGTSFLSFGNTSIAMGSTSSANIVNQGSTLTAVGNTLSAIGLTNSAQSATLFALVGNSASSFGSTSIDPTTVFGFLIRAQELAEGNNVYTKATGVLDLFSRGSSTLLREKTIADTSSTTTKT